ncbi:hypothetical protein QAD02_000578 [Eretmocerus hayati]|uniref:Uncharacterized protein n=1 Tax=Eretmocerus hayati TaxID=131215 RepID=A0ACC2NG50_9HYME|nr:hypothetical protein QAD02_000578 [Eretmocerus hayati]
MFAKISLLCLALCSSGIHAAPQYLTASSYPSYQAPTLAATHEQVYRSPDNLGSISTHGKSVITPYSTSNKQVTSITNPGYYTTGLTYPSVAAPTYQAPSTSISYPSQFSASIAPVAAPVAYNPSYPASINYRTQAAAAPVSGTGLLGVAFSPSVAVAHMTYTDPRISYTF